ncbi:acyl carrier protein [Plantactinospora sp. CA-294935]|uniref:acyl carrier protein n=1 Tax=Plantactinospora sp. CA-294935 TaxID=3240012 RepID=UPI003D9211AC
MLIRKAIAETVVRQVHGVLEDNGAEAGSVDLDASLVELGFTSLMLAELLVNLEAELEVDPFQETSISDVGSVGELVAAYETAHARTAGVTGE